MGSISDEGKVSAERDKPLSDSRKSWKVNPTPNIEEAQRNLITQNNATTSPEIVEIADKLNQLLLELVNLKYELLREKREKEEILKNYEILKGEKSELDKLLSSKIQETHTLNAKIRTLELQNHTIAVQLSEIEEKLGEERKVREKLLEVLKEREECICDLKLRLTEKNKEVEDLEGRIQKLTSESSQYIITIGRLELANQELAEKLTTYEYELKRLQDNIASSEEFINKLKSENESLSSELRSLRELIDTQQSVVATLIGEKNKLQRELKELEKDIAQKNQELEKEISKRKLLETKQEEVLIESARLIEKLDELRRENEKISEENKYLKEKNLKLQETVEYWESRVKNIKEELNQTFAGENIKYKDLEKRLLLSFYSLPDSERNLLNLLLHANILDLDQVNSIKSLMCNGFIASVEFYLVENAIVDETTVYMALSIINGIPFIHLRTEDIDSTLVCYLGVNYCLEKLIVPLKTAGSNLPLAMANPKDEVLLEMIAKKVNKQVSRLYTSPTKIIEVIEELFIEE
ncbi:MAG: hypothetical protein N3G21_12255 [Candidatus Hydrogenedentes bacterium]|nr:hypothetical protein [Candidatus Hydrogenedentota bacterium]